MDWYKIEQITGHKIAFASLVGSKRHGLVQENSDTDYAIFVFPDANSDYLPNDAYNILEAGEGDLFFHDISKENTIVDFASIYIVPTYASIVYGIPCIVNFINEHHNDLANISPFNTYRTCVEMVEEHLKTNRHSSIARSVRDASFIYNFMETGDMESSFYLNDRFLALYQDLHNNNCVLKCDDIRKELGFLNDKAVWDFFCAFPANTDLFEEFKNILMQEKRKCYEENV